MASLQAVLQQVYYDHIDLAFRRFYNYHQLTLYNHKITCYQQQANSPIEYYECFDKIEKTAIKDMQAGKRAYQEFQDQLTICRYQCKKVPPPEAEQCIQKCKEKVKGTIIEYYRQLYRSKIDKAAFGHINKLVKLQK